MALAVVAAAFGILITNCLWSAHNAWVLINFPFGVDYGEGIVWQQMRNMLAGHAYGPLGIFPAIVYHYPPVYHLTVGAASAATGIDQLAMGRTVSTLSAFGTAGLIASLTVAIRPSANRLANAAGGLLAATLFLTTDPVSQWGPLMRVDMLSCLFTLAGLLLAIRAVRRSSLIGVSALCFVLAVYAKQTSIAAPMAAFIGLLLVRPRLAWALAGSSFIIGIVPLVALEWLTDGGFLRHLLAYNINRFVPDQIWALILPLRQHIIYIAFSISGAALLIGDLRKHWSRRANNLALASAISAIAYFGLKTLMLGMMLKSGASYNYLIEWFCAVAILVGIAGITAIEAIGALFRQPGAGQTRSILAPMAIMFGIAVQAYALPPHRLTMEAARSETIRASRIVRLIQASPKPVISDDMTLLIRAGRDVQWEPAIAAELGATGRYDQPGFVRLIDQRRFGLFITDGDRGPSSYNGRYNPPVADAITRDYPQTWKMGRFVIHAPAR